MLLAILLACSSAFQAYHCDTTKSPTGIRTHCVEKSPRTKKIISSWRRLNDEPDGIAEEWYEDGGTKIRLMFHQGRYVDSSFHFFPDGSKSRAIRCDSKGEICTDTMWHSNRRVARLGTIVLGKDAGVIRSFDEKGILLSLESYGKDGKKDGVEAFWSSKYLLRDSTIYKDGLVMARYNRDTTTGRWRSWWIYESDGQTLKSAEVFDPNGNSSGKVVNGTGSIVFYNLKGVAIGRDTYKDGLLVKDETFGD